MFDFNFDLDDAIDAQRSAKVNAVWRKVSIKPNPITGEKYNIGILLEHQGKVYSKFISGRGRLNCLFDDAAIENVMFSIRYIKELIALPKWQETKHPYLISEPRTAQGESVEEILEDIFLETVPLGRPDKSLALTEEAQTITDQRESVTESVRSYLLKHSPDNKRFIPDNTNFKMDEEGHTIEIPLMANKQAADIVGALYTRPNHIVRAVKNTAFDLRTFKEYKGNSYQTGIFILRPSIDMGFTKQQIAKADDVLNGLYWMVKDIHIEVQDDIPTLSEYIEDWYGEQKQA